MRESVRKYQRAVPRFIADLGVNVVLPALAALTVGALVLGNATPVSFLSSSPAQPAMRPDPTASWPIPYVVHLPRPDQVVYVRVRQTDGNGKLELTREEWSQFTDGDKLAALHFVAKDAHGRLIAEGWSAVAAGRLIIYTPANKTASVATAQRTKTGTTTLFLSSDFAVPGRANDVLSRVRTAEQAERLPDRQVAGERALVARVRSGAVVTVMTVGQQSGRLLSYEETVAKSSQHSETTLRTVTQYTFLSVAHVPSLTDAVLPAGTHCQSWSTPLQGNIPCPSQRIRLR